MKRLIHYLAHRFGWWSGRVVSEFRDTPSSSTVWIGFKCDVCGVVEYWHPSQVQCQRKA